MNQKIDFYIIELLYLKSSEPWRDKEKLTEKNQKVTIGISEKCFSLLLTTSWPGPLEIHIKGLIYLWF